MSIDIIYPEQIKSIAKFIDYVQGQCDANDIELIFGPNKYLGSGEHGKCAGYFDHEGKELAVATGRDIRDWFEVLVHEYAHLTQWIDKEPSYMEAYVGPQNEDCPGDIIDKWYKGLVEIPEEKLREYFNLIKYLELDNERRSVNLIKLHNLPLDLDRYIRRANAYVYFHIASEYYRKWYNPDWDLFDSEQLLKLMPSNLDDENDYELLPGGTQKIYYELMHPKEDDQEEAEEENEDEQEEPSQS